MFLSLYATVIVGAMPVIANEPTNELMVPAKTIFKTPPSLYTVPTLCPSGLVGSANKVNLSMTIGVVESSWRK